MSKCYDIQRTTVNLLPLGPNFNKVSVGECDFWFNYQTCVGFWSRGTGLVISENLWGPTTGKHLNVIGDKKFRVNRETFDRLMDDVLNGDAS